MKKNDTIYLQFILEAILTIEEYLQDVNEENFKATRLLQDGTFRQIEIIGKAMRHISKDLRTAYPEIPWQDSVGMPDKLLRDGFDVDIEKVWGTTQENLPVLKEQVIGILKDFGFE